VSNKEMYYRGIKSALVVVAGKWLELVDEPPKDIKKAFARWLAMMVRAVDEESRWEEDGGSGDGAANGDQA